MEPVTTAIVTALAAGAGAGLKETATQAIEDAYAKLKSWIHDRHPGVSIEKLEEQPASQGRREMVGEDLERTGASADPEVVRRARRLVDLIEEQAPEAARAIGVDLGVLQNAKVTFQDVLAAKGATGVKVGTVTGGELSFGNVAAGTERDDVPKKS